jgi:molybdopterin-binding protein
VLSLLNPAFKCPGSHVAQISAFKTLDDSPEPDYPVFVTLSARNRLKGQIVELELGEVMAHVVVKVGENLVESVITKRSAQEMKLKIGDTVSAIIKSTEVMLEK